MTDLKGFLGQVKRDMSNYEDPTWVTSVEVDHSIDMMLADHAPKMLRILELLVSSYDHAYDSGPIEDWLSIREQGVGEGYRHRQGQFETAVQEVLEES